MGRWEPDARGRLAQAALELFAERGFDRTTVAEIAARAGLTERTFFRYFTDKREVLFWGSDALRAVIVDTVSTAAASTSPFEAVAAALEAAAASIQERATQDGARRRHAVVAAHAELRERELIKLASLAAAVADTLRRSGAADPTASLVAETGMAVFKVAFERWVEDAERRDFVEHVREALDALEEFAGGSRGRRPQVTTKARAPRPKATRRRRATG